MTKFTILEQDAKVGLIDTDAGTAEYSGSDPVLDLLIDEIRNDVFAEDFKDAEMGDSRQFIKKSDPIEDTSLDEYARTILEDCGVEYREE